MAEGSNRVPEDLWTVLCNVCKLRTYTKGAVLFSAGEPPQGVYLIEKGAVGISLHRPASQGWQQTAKAGAVLALSEAMTGERHKFTAQALEDSQAWFVERQQFLNLLQQNQLLCLQIIRLLSDDLHRLYHTVQASRRRVARPGRQGGKRVN